MPFHATRYYPKSHENHDAKIFVAGTLAWVPVLEVSWPVGAAPHIGPVEVRASATNPLELVISIT